MKKATRFFCMVLALLLALTVPALAEDIFTPSEFMEYYERSYTFVDAVLSSKTNYSAADSMDWQKCNVTKVSDDPITYENRSEDFTIIFDTDDAEQPASYARIAVTNASNPISFAYPFISTFYTYGTSINLNALVEAFRWLDMVKAMNDPEIGLGFEPDDYSMAAVRPGNQYALVITVVDKSSALAKNYVELKKGSKGDAVKTLQERLNAAGYSVGSVDGDFGGKTETAITNFQHDNLLPQTGALDLVTYTLLYSGVSSASGTSGANEASTIAEPVQSVAGSSQSDGWYVSDDGKFGIYPTNLQRDSYGTYTVDIQIREEASKTVVANTELDLGQESFSLSLSEEGAIQNFIKEGSGKYSFDVVCDLKSGGFTVQRQSNFTITIG